MEQQMNRQNEENEKIWLEKLAERLHPSINPIYCPRYCEPFNPTIKVDGPVEEFDPEWALWTNELLRR